MHLVALLHFIYHGEVEVDQSDIPHVIMIAASLRIRELAVIASHIEMNSPTGKLSTMLSCFTTIYIGTKSIQQANTENYETFLTYAF